MKEILIKQVQFNPEEKEILEELRRLLRDSKLPDSILFTSKFKTNKIKLDLYNLQSNLIRSQEIIKILLGKIK